MLLPEDYDPWERLYDCEFLFGALWRFGRAVRVAENVPGIASRLILLIKRFDDSLPALRKMRNVLEHADEYGVDAHHFNRRKASHPDVHRQQVQVMSWDEDSLTWLGETVTTTMRYTPSLSATKGSRTSSSPGIQ